jgi:superfamily I DNA/RNA helicase
MVKKNIREMEREGRFPLFRFPHLFSTLLSPTGNGFGEIPPISRPFVYEIYGAPFQHLLWDEFQDTSLPQYNALLPLLEEIHSSSEEGFLLVGDPKQSIHIFRDAYPELLKEVAERFSLTTPEETRANYRTVPDLLKFFHRFFSTAGEILEKSLFQPLPNELLEDKKKWIPFYREIYTDKELDLLPKREGPGFVLLCGLKVLKGKEEKGEYIFEKEKEGSEWDKTVLEKIVLSEPSLSEESPLSTFFSLPSWIQRFKDMGYSLEDMTILTRKREEGKKILTFLNKNGIPAISSESLSLSKDPLIQTLTHLIYYLFSSQLHTEKKDSLQNFYLWSSAIYLEDWLTEEKGEIPLNTLLSWIKEWAMKGKEKTQGFSTPLTLFYELTTVPLPFLSSKTLWEDPSAISSLSSMEEALRKFMEESGDDPGTFLAGWDSFLQKEKIPLFSGKGTTILSTEKRGGGKGGIQILTIHEAKGLENKVVFLPFLTWEFLGKGRRNEEEGIFVSGETLSSLFANLPLPKEISYPIPLKNHLMEILTSSPELFSDPLTKELLYRIVRKIVEEINLLYVGFTRARDILVGFTVVDPKTDKNDSFLFPYNNLSQIITKIIQEILSKEDLPSVFPIGFFRKEEDEKRIQKMEEYLSSFQPEIEKKGEDKPFHPPPSPRTSTHLSLLTPHIRSFREKEDERKREGERVHRILRLVRTLDDLPILSRLRSLTEKEEKIVTTLLSHKEIAPFFSPQTTHRWTIHREVSLLVQGRIVTPDRVLIEKGGRSAVVIEFKGILRKGVSEEVVSRYRNQVVMYLNSLKEMGWIPERGYLVFLDQVEEIEGTR